MICMRNLINQLLKKMSVSLLILRESIEYVKKLKNSFNIGFMSILLHLLLRYVSPLVFVKKKPSINKCNHLFYKNFTKSA